MKYLALVLLLLLFASPALAQAPASAADAQARARTQLREIVSRSEFQSPSAAPTNPLEKVADWWRKRWAEFTKWFEKLFSLTPKIISNSVIVWVFIGAFLVFALRLMIPIWRNRYKTPALRNVPLSFTEEIEEFPSAEAWLERARGYAGADDYAKAYRALFVALLLLLDAESVVPFKKHRANGEYLQLLLKSPALYAELKPAFWRFDTHCYGGRAAEAEDYALTLALYEKLPALARRTAAGRLAEGGTRQ